MKQKSIVPLEEGWRKIKEQGIDNLEHTLDNGIDKSRKLFTNEEYMDIYTTCYDMCTQRTPHNFSEQLYARHGQTFESYLSLRVLPSLAEYHDDYLLREIVRRWEDNRIMNSWMCKFFTYLDRHYVSHYAVPTLMSSGEDYFKRIVFNPTKSRVISALISIINHEREGVGMDRNLVKSVIDLYVSMGNNSTDSNIYTDDLQAPLVHTTHQFFKVVSESMVSMNSTPDYLNLVDDILRRERDRVRSVLLPQSESAIISAVVFELIERWQKDLLSNSESGLTVLLMNEKTEDLSKMFRLISLTSSGLATMSDMFHNYLTSVARGLIHDTKSSSEVSLVKEMIVLHDKYSNMVKTCFGSHALFHKSMKESFESVFNSTTEDFGDGQSFCQLLCIFADNALKSGSPSSGSFERLSEDESERMLDDTISLFSYLQDKDVFADVYRSLLAKRLLDHKSFSNDLERSVISKMKLRCGAQFTTKLEGMLNDFSIGSSSSSRQFEEWVAEPGNRTADVSVVDGKIFVHQMEFSVQVLTTGYWPTYRDISTLLPPSLFDAVNLFGTCYHAVNSHRKLAWVHSLGQVIVRGLYDGDKRIYDFHLTTLQACVLVFVSSNVHGVGYGNIKDRLNIDDDLLKRILYSFCNSKTRIFEKDEENSYKVNNAFKSSKRKITVTMPSSIESSSSRSMSEDFSSNNRVEEDRSLAIEASIVRIMKARKVMGHQQLVGEVLNQLSLFRPQPKVIKRRIEALMEREYLERDPANATIYRYLA